jgi:membrane protein
MRYHSHMHFKTTEQHVKDRALNNLASLERTADTVYSKLVTERRWFVVISAAISDFFEKKMYYYTGYWTYNAFLAVIALLVAMSATVGWIVSAYPSLKGKFSTSLKGLSPVLGGSSGDALKSMVTYRNVMGVLGFIGLMWTATRIFGALEWGFCRIWNSKRRSFARGRLLGLVMGTGVGLIFFLSVMILFGFTAAWGWMVGKSGAAFTIGTTVMKPIIGLGINFLLFLFIFQFVPTVKQRLRRSAVGALITGAIFLAIQYGLGFYFTHISNMPSTYGGIATVIVLLIWLQVTGMVTFLGAEIIHAIADDELVAKHKETASVPNHFRAAVEKRDNAGVSPDQRPDAPETGGSETEGGV